MRSIRKDIRTPFMHRGSIEDSLGDIEDEGEICDNFHSLE